MMLCPVILAGGEGNRLWPLSRRHYPKQLIRLFGEHSLLQETLLRCAGLEANIQMLPTLIICNEAYRFVVAEQVAEISQRAQPIILEPVGRNTAPALTVAALAQLEQGNDPLLLMLPADHLVENKRAFQQALEVGAELAGKQFIVTLGIEPARASTGYGYIKRGRQLKIPGSSNAFQVADFTEKPGQALAAEYLRSHRYFWNSGIFMLQASVWLAAIRELREEIYLACTTAYKNGKEDNDFFRLAEQPFADCPNDSVDYAVMERLAETGNIHAAVIPLDAGWSDIGVWSEVWRHGTKDKDDNVTIGDVVTEGTTNSLIRSDKRLVATLGCDNLAVIETADAVLVLNKDKSQDIRQLITTLRAQGREELNQHSAVQRPWGGYDSIETGAGYQVKRLVIRPGQRISLQLHRKRSEHWVVIKGTATVTRGEQVFDLEVNESTFIPPGVEHRLENRTRSVLELIEVQVGEYLGEDDIVRLDDDFNR